MKLFFCFLVFSVIVVVVVVAFLCYGDNNKGMVFFFFFLGRARNPRNGIERERERERVWSEEKGREGRDRCRERGRDARALVKVILWLPEKI